MANNRLFLIHTTSGMGVLLGKHYGEGWLDTDVSMRDFYTKVYSYYGKTDASDFELFDETSNEWNYSDLVIDGIRFFSKTKKLNTMQQLSETENKREVIDVLNKGYADGSVKIVWYMSNSILCKGVVIDNKNVHLEDFSDVCHLTKEDVVEWIDKVLMYGVVEQEPEEYEGLFN